MTNSIYNVETVRFEYMINLEMQRSDGREKRLWISLTLYRRHVTVRSNDRSRNKRAGCRERESGGPHSLCIVEKVRFESMDDLEKNGIVDDRC